MPFAETSVPVEAIIEAPRSVESAPSALGRMSPGKVLGLLLFATVIATISYPSSGTGAALILTIVAILIYNGYRNGEVEHEVRVARDAKIVCPQCHSRGCVTTSIVKLKKGISGAKATGAVLTGGLSLLAVGLSRKEDLTEAECSNCGSVWHF
jgi:hypothetical protein